MGWLVLIFLVASSALLLVPVLTHPEWLAARARAARSLPAGPALAPDSVLREYRCFGDWFDEEPMPGTRPGSDQLRARYRFTVMGVLPTWMSMHCDGAGLIARVAFGAAAREVPSGWSVLASSGDLILESPLFGHVDGERPRTAIEVAERLVAAYRVAGPAGIEPRLKQALLEEDEPAALRLLAKYFGASDSTRALIRAALTNPSPEVRLAAAQSLGSEADAALDALVLDPQLSAALREEAALALAERKRWTSLIAALQACPQGIEIPLLHSLAGHRDEDIERAVLPLLACEQSAVVEAAADLLARQGTRNALAALRQRLTGPKLESGAETGIAVALDLIQQRAPGGQVGALAVVEGGDVDAAGGLSLGPEAGALSDVGPKKS